ncbi:MAG: hypothetical protein ACJAVF_003313 [Paraglaciecola sp.]|jgi:hypothetical protein
MPFFKREPFLTFALQNKIYETDTTQCLLTFFIDRLPK